MNNLRATDETIEALRGNDIGDAMDRLVERALGDCAETRTVAGVPSGLSRDASQAKPLINYRKGEVK